MEDFVGRWRSDGTEQLHPSVDLLQPVVLWLRIRPLRATRISASRIDRRRNLLRTTSDESSVAPSLPIWPSRMAMAITNLWTGAVYEASPLCGSRMNRRHLAKVTPDLVVKAEDKGPKVKLQFSNLRIDPGEVTNVLAREQDKVKRTLRLAQGGHREWEGR